MLPVAGPKVPTVQPRQLEAPTRVENKPNPHDEHVLAAKEAYVPPGHDTQAVAEDDDWYFPVPQTLHWSAAVAEN